MSIVCPKCNLLRPDDSLAPQWQCPGCGVAYAKALAADSAGQRGQGITVWREREQKPVWHLWLMAAALVWGLVAGMQMAYQRGGAIVGDFWGGSAASPDQLRTLAAAMQPDEILMFKTDWCPYCRQARGWLDRHGFGYRTCDIETEAVCTQAFERLGGERVPYLIVKGQHIKGFDPDELGAAVASSE